MYNKFILTTCSVILYKQQTSVGRTGSIPPPFLLLLHLIIKHLVTLTEENEEKQTTTGVDDLAYAAIHSFDIVNFSIRLKSNVGFKYFREETCPVLDSFLCANTQM